MNKETLEKVKILDNNIRNLEKLLSSLKDKSKVIRIQSFPTIPIPKGCTYNDAWNDICFIDDNLRQFFIEVVDIKLKELEKELEEL